jgi:hypothetical protein
MITLEITNQENFDSRLLLPKEIKEKWLTALRSGEYGKTTGKLCQDNKYCCLGVLCEIQQRPKENNKESIFPNSFLFDDSSNYLSKENDLFEILSSDGRFRGFSIKVGSSNFQSLAKINDGMDSFDEVIEVIEQYF